MKVLVFLLLGAAAVWAAVFATKVSSRILDGWVNRHKDSPATVRIKYFIIIIFWMAILALLTELPALIYDKIIGWRF